MACPKRRRIVCTRLRKESVEAGTKQPSAPAASNNTTIDFLKTLKHWHNIGG